jgi:NAD(P)-dependent dehydrogenase (short-subunit alcohol dehydrogenase family)
MIGKIFNAIYVALHVFFTTYLLPHLGFFRIDFGGPEQKRRRVILITGCDTGFGYSSAKKLDAEGFTGMIILSHAAATPTTEVAQPLFISDAHALASFVSSSGEGAVSRYNACEILQYYRCCARVSVFPSATLSNVVAVVANCLTKEGAERLKKECSKHLRTLIFDVTDLKAVEKAYTEVERICGDGGKN